MFSKDLYCRHVKTKACLGKMLKSILYNNLLVNEIQWSFSLSLYHTIPTFIDPEKRPFENEGLLGKRKQEGHDGPESLT